MKVWFLSLMLVSAVATIACAAGTSPMTDPLIEEREITIACELTEAPRKTEVPVFQTLKEAEAAKGLYHYLLWLPKGYLESGNKRWPCIFLMAPGGGHVSLGKKGDYLQTSGLVIITLLEAENGPWPPIIGNFLSAHDDVVKRVRIDESQKFASGFSGGARGSSVFVQLRPGFVGLLLNSAGPSYKPDNTYNVSGIVRNPKLYTALLMGKKDKNYDEVARTAAVIPKSRFRFFEFDGGHQQAPPDVYVEAFTWLRQKSARTNPNGSDPLKPLGTPAPLTLPPLKPR